MTDALLERFLRYARGGGEGTIDAETFEHDIHSPDEWTCLQEMHTAVRVVVDLVRAWSTAS